MTEVIDPCAEAEQHLQEYFDRMLAAEVAEAIESHLAACESCANAYKFEAHFRLHVKKCCAGAETEERCREEFRQQLQRCREAS
jgi:anti-sigma factor (TIGR02949 family)